MAGPSRILDLEVPAVREALAQTPDALLHGSAGLVVVDEVQRMLALFEVLRPICDDPDRRAVYLLLGSASFDVIKGVSKTLAGRIQFVDVPGFSLSEVGADEQAKLWMRGGFPRAFLPRRSQHGRDGCNRSPRPSSSGISRAWARAHRPLQSGTSGACWPTTTGRCGTRPSWVGRWMPGRLP